MSDTSSYPGGPVTSPGTVGSSNADIYVHCGFTGASGAVQHDDGSSKGVSVARATASGYATGCYDVTFPSGNKNVHVSPPQYYQATGYDRSMRCLSAVPSGAARVVVLDATGPTNPQQGDAFDLHLHVEY
jgi:hypothetical protein